MSGAFVQVAPDSTGKKVQTFENAIGLDTVEAQGVVPVDSTGVALGSASNALRIDPTGATTQPVSGLVSVANFPATQTVSGTVTANLGSTVTIAADTAANQANALKVDGSGVTQPISGSVSVSNFPATQPVSGTFWQATQPISGSVSVSNFPASQAVTGTFWQATQPVSGTVTANIGTGNLAGITGTVTVSGTVTANAGTGSFTIAAPTLTKGTQGSTGLSVQSLKDAGRTAVVLNASGIATVATEALVTMQKYVAGAVTTGVTEYVVTAGKTLRVQQIIISFRPTTPSTTVTFVSCTWKLRRGTATLTATSSLVATATMLAATNVPSSAIQMDIPDGLEFAAADHIGFTQIGSATTGTFDITLIGFEY